MLSLVVDSMGSPQYHWSQGLRSSHSVVMGQWECKWIRCLIFSSAKCSDTEQHYGDEMLEHIHKPAANAGRYIPTMVSSAPEPETPEKGLGCH